MKEAQEEEEAGAESNADAQEAIQEENLTDEEKEALARQKAEEEGAAKDKAMKDEAQAFTDSLPRKGSYDYAQDQADKKA